MGALRRPLLIIPFGDVAHTQPPNLGAPSIARLCARHLSVVNAESGAGHGARHTEEVNDEWCHSGSWKKTRLG